MDKVIDRAELTAADVRLGSRQNNGFYLHCGDHIARCTYQATTGIEGFGAARRRATYPAGAIRVPFEKLHRDVPSLDDAKEWLAGMVATAEAPPNFHGIPSTIVHGHDRLHALNYGYFGDGQPGLYVIKSGNGVSCLGFLVADRKARAVTEWIGGAWDDGLQPGTVEHWDAYDAAMGAGAAFARKTKSRCDAELIPALIPFEGKRVRVILPDGESSVFRVGKSTGWMPLHLEIMAGEDGGAAAYVPEGARVELA